MRQAANVDANQPDIVRRLRQLPGVTVQVLSTVGFGCPDIAVGYRGRTFFLEIKDGSKPPSRQKLTRLQRKWHLLWTGHVTVVKTFEDACYEIGYPVWEANRGIR